MGGGVVTWLAVIGTFLVGLVVGVFVGAFVGVAGERLAQAQRDADLSPPSITDLQRARARRRHPTSHPHPWN